MPEIVRKNNLGYDNPVGIFTSNIANSILVGGFLKHLTQNTIIFLQTIHYVLQKCCLD